MPPRTKTLLFGQSSIFACGGPTSTPLSHCPSLAPFLMSSHFLFLPLYTSNRVLVLTSTQTFLMASVLFTPGKAQKVSTASPPWHRRRQSPAHVQSQCPCDLCFLHAFLGVFLSFGAWLRVLLGERDYSFFLFGGRRVSTQRASESWQTLDEVAGREQEGVRLVSAVVPPKLWAVDGGEGCWLEPGMLGLHLWSWVGR